MESSDISASDRGFRLGSRPSLPSFASVQGWFAPGRRSLLRVIDQKKFLSQYSRHDRVAGPSTVTPIEAGRNRLGREKQTFQCLSFLLRFQGLFLVLRFPWSLVSSPFNSSDLVSGGADAAGLAAGSTCWRGPVACRVPPVCTASARPATGWLMP